METICRKCGLEYDDPRDAQAEATGNIYAGLWRKDICPDCWSDIWRESRERRKPRTRNWLQHEFLLWLLDDGDEHRVSNLDLEVEYDEWLERKWLDRKDANDVNWTKAIRLAIPTAKACLVKRYGEVRRGFHIPLRDPMRHQRGHPTKMQDLIKAAMEGDMGWENYDAEHPDSKKERRVRWEVTNPEKHAFLRQQIYARRLTNNAQRSRKQSTIEAAERARVKVDEMEKKLRESGILA